jgi:hypothetical protein
MVDFSTKEDIQSLVDERVRETATLEFKRALPPSEKNVALAKDLAAWLTLAEAPLSSASAKDSAVLRSYIRLSWRVKLNVLLLSLASLLMNPWYSGTLPML